MSGLTIKTKADVGAWAFINGGDFVHRGGGKWTRPSVLEFAERYPQRKVPGFTSEIVYRIPNEVPEHGRPLSVGALKAGSR